MRLSRPALASPFVGVPRGHMPATCAGYLQPESACDSPGRQCTRWRKARWRGTGRSSTASDSSSNSDRVLSCRLTEPGRVAVNLRQGAAMMTRGYADGSEVFGAIQESEIVAKRRDLRRFSDQPVAEIVQCGEPISSFAPIRKHVERLNVSRTKRVHPRVVPPRIRRCKMRRVRDLWAPTIVLIALVGREGQRSRIHQSEGVDRWRRQQLRKLRPLGSVERR